MVVVWLLRCGVRIYSLLRLRGLVRVLDLDCWVVGGCKRFLLIELLKMLVGGECIEDSWWIRGLECPFSCSCSCSFLPCSGSDLSAFLAFPALD